jgi:hypothetical protein
LDRRSGGFHSEVYNTPHQVQVVAQGNTFTAYIDGQAMLTATDSTYASGGVGLRSWGLRFRQHDY